MHLEDISESLNLEGRELTRKGEPHGLAVPNNATLISEVMVRQRRLELFFCWREISVRVCVCVGLWVRTDHTLRNN